VSINLFCEKFHFDFIAVPCSAIAHRGGAAMKFFADFTLFSARYCGIAAAAWKAKYGLWAIIQSNILLKTGFFDSLKGLFLQPFTIDWK